MKRLAALAAALCLMAPALASAKGVILIQTTKYEINTAPQANVYSTASAQAISDLAWLYTRGFVEAMGGSGGYDVIRTTTKTRTTDLASGLINGVQYEWGIGIGRMFTVTVGVNNILATCYPCSLTMSQTATDMGLTSYQPKIPWLWIEVPNNEGGFNTTANCSTGVSSNTGASDPAHQFAGYGGGRIWVPQGGYNWPMNQAGSVLSTIASAGDTSSGTLGAKGGLTLVDGSMRIVVGAKASNWYQYPFAGTPPAWRDSLYSDSWFQQTFAKNLGSVDGQHPFMTPDSANVTSWGVYVWDDPGSRWASQPGVDASLTKSMTYVHWLSPGSVHSFGGTQGTFYEALRMSGVPEVIGLGVVHFDSLTGGKVLVNKRPLSLAIGVTGLGSSGSMYGQAGGQWVSDSTTMKATLDSLRFLGVPIVGAVDTDSLALLSWAPSQVKNFLQRGFRLAVERDADNTQTLTQQFAALSAYGRVDRTLWGNKSDFTATQLGVCSPTQADSVAYAIRYAGFTGIAMNAEEDSSLSMSNSPPWHATQRIMPAANGQLLRVFTYPGFNHRGAAMGNGRDSAQIYNWAELQGATGSGVASYSRWAPNDSTFASHYMHRTIIGAIAQRWIEPFNRNTVFNKRDSSGTIVNHFFSPYVRTKYWGWHGEPELTGTISAKANVNTGTNLIRVSLSSLGSGQWGAASPNRPGFYQIKYTVAWANAMNKLAGQTVVRFVYPEELTARDMQR